MEEINEKNIKNHYTTWEHISCYVKGKVVPVLN
jgi:hypothetical protein